MPYFYLQKRPPTEESIKIPFFCHTKRTSEPKMPYFYLKKGPIYQDTAGTHARSTLEPEITQKHKQNRAQLPGVFFQ